MRFLLLLLIPGLAWGESLAGQDIVLHGNNNGALPCAACHGVTGMGNPSMGAPALAGLPAGVIIQALTQMAQGRGGNAIMQSIARSLTPEERSAVATYFSSLKRR